jgi:hypothetical protein
MRRANDNHLGFARSQILRTRTKYFLTVADPGPESAASRSDATVFLLDPDGNEIEIYVQCNRRNGAKIPKGFGCARAPSNLSAALLRFCKR